MGVRQENRWIGRCIKEAKALNDEHGQREALRMRRIQRQPMAHLPATPTRAAVRRWMRLNRDECDDSATILAQSAASAMGLPIAWLDDEAHWIWDVAAQESDRG